MYLRVTVGVAQKTPLKCVLEWERERKIFKCFLRQKRARRSRNKDRATANSSNARFPFFFSSKITACRCKLFVNVFLSDVKTQAELSVTILSQLYWRNFYRNFSSGSKTYADDVFSWHSTSLRLGEDEISAKFTLAGKMLTQQHYLCSLGFVR